MPMRVGEMMVIVRAQDFASRTLRRVSSEFSAMSQAQRMEAARQATQFRKMSAMSQVALAESNARRLKYIADGNAISRSLTEGERAMQRYMKAQRAVFNQTGKNRGRFRSGVPREAIREWQNAAAEVRRLGLEGVLASRRLARVRDAIDARGARGATPAQAKELRNAQRAMSALGAEGERQAKLWPRLTKHLANYQDRLAKMPMSLQVAARNQRAFGDAMFQNNRQLQTAYNNLSKATRAEMAFNQAVAALPAQQLDRMAHALSGVGRTMQLFGAVGTVAFGVAAQKAAEFNTQMSLAATQARDLDAPASQVNKRIDQLSNGFVQNGEHIDGVLDLMNKYPASASDMAAATYDIFSSMDLERNGVIDVAKGLGLLEKANQVAVAGGGSLEEATSAMITTFNNFGFSTEQQTENLDTMFDIVRFGRMRMADFNIMMNKIAPAAADAGNSLRDVGGAMAYLTTVMPSQRMVATGISRLLEALRHPDVVAGLHMFGVEAKRTNGKLRPLPAIIKDIARTFPELTTGQKSAAEFFREISAAGRGGGRGQIFTQEGRRALSEIVTHMQEYLDAQRRIDANKGEFARAREAQMKSLGVQWEIFKNRISAVAIAIGQDAIPAFVEFGKILSGFLHWWNNLDEGTREAIVRFGVMTSIFTLLAGVALALLGSILALEAGFRRLLIGGSGAAGMMGNLLMVAKRLAAIGVIIITIKAIQSGDVKAWDLIGAMLAGAAIGSRFGWQGAAIGAISAPLVLDLVVHINKMRAPKFKSEVERAYMDYYKKHKQEVGSPDFISYKDFRKQWMKARAGVKLSHGDDIHETARKRHEAVTEQQKKATQATKNHNDALGKYYKAMQAAREANDEFARSLKDWNRQLVLATEQAGEQTIQSLRNLYMQMEQENRAAMGDLFKGPWLTSTTFDLAKQWGIKPRIDDMIKDLTMQGNAFNKFERGLNKLVAKGVPREFLAQIRKMGPEEGQSFIDAMLTAKPEQIKKLVTRWKANEKRIKQQTKMDFTDEIAQWKKAGVSMGDAIKDGFESAKVGVWFDNWVSKTFPGVISAAVNEAVAEWRKANPRPVKPKGPPKPPPMPQNTGFPFSLPGKNAGMLTAGNLDLLHRQVAKLPGGKIATVDSFSIPLREALKGAAPAVLKMFGNKAGEVLLPHIIKGKKLSDEAAINWFRKFGRNLGVFDTPAHATAYAKRLHQQQAQYYGPGGKGAAGATYVDNSTTVNITYNDGDHKGSPGAGRGGARKAAWRIAQGVKHHS